VMPPGIWLSAVAKSLLRLGMVSVIPVYALKGRSKAVSGTKKNDTTNKKPARPAYT